MSYYEIQGGRPLEGRLEIHGAKNSVLPILAATLLAPGESVIENCPRLSDVSATLDILRLLGCRVEREGGAVTVDASALIRCQIPESLMREMRSSVIFLGAMLARLGTLLERYDLPRRLDLPETAWRQYLLRDKKRSGGEMTIAVLERPGHGVLWSVTPEELLEETRWM